VIPVDEIVARLRAAIAGDVLISCVGLTWNEVYAGDVAFWFGDWKIEIFNDGDSFDYINQVESPDGRKAVFEDWWGDREIPICPENQLLNAELDKLTRLLESAQHWPDVVGCE
jgi:hypothetical protein